MSTFTRFEDIRAWKKAREVTRIVYEITGRGAFREDIDLGRQIRRASVSSMSNIAEGFERGGTAEFIHCLTIARASAAEARSLLYVALDAGYINDATFKHCYG